MNRPQALAILAAALLPLAASAQFDQMKGKMKPGLYEMKMEMDMPNMPKGMPKMGHTMQHCVTAQDIESGKTMKPQDPKGGSKDCEVKDFKMSGNTASYKMVCKPDMTSESHMTFTDNGYHMETKMTMTQNGQPMNMTHKIDSKYLGPCK